MIDDKLKHKPQKKHTLEEVLKSLQDLIRNDLIAAQQVARPAPPAPALPEARDSFDAALDTLDHLIDHELVVPVTQARTAPPAPEALELPDDDLPTDETGPDDDTLIRESLEAEALNAVFDAGKDLAPTEVPAGDDAPTGSQNAFAFDAPPVDEPPRAEDEAPNEPITEPETNESDVARRSNTARYLPADDIPVLHEVAHEILAAHPGLPTPEQARDIAVHVVAHLNIELRKGGAQPLDPSTIDRLQELLREALASKSSNS